jgi:uncharacterized protein YcbK (DUF882 family)
MKQTTRRTVLTGLFGASVGAGFLVPAQATASRALAFKHTHTGGKLDLVYAEAGDYLPDALRAIDSFLKDFRTGDMHPIDRTLLDALYQLANLFDHPGEFQVISGFRSPKTNAQLRKKSGGVAKKSYHMQGRAIDVRLTGARTADLAKAARSLNVGGVGFYPRSDFIHLDTGPVRSWGG